MVTPYPLWFCAPGTLEGQIFFGEGVRSGQLVIADAFHPQDAAQCLEQWMAVIREGGTSYPTRYGLRLATRDATRVAKECECTGLGLLVLVGDGSAPALQSTAQEWRRKGVRILWEYSINTRCPLDASLLDGIVVRGYETGGISQSLSIRTLFARAQAEHGDQPTIVQGAESPELGAVFLALGAEGLILDATAHFAVESVSSPQWDLSKCHVSGFTRTPCGPYWVDVRYSGAGTAADAGTPLGPGVLSLFDRKAHDPVTATASFRNDTDLILGRLLDASDEELNQLCATPLFVQGPMAGISTSAGFADALQKEGFFPVFALTALKSDGLQTLAQEIAGSKCRGSYGIGVSGQGSHTPQQVLECLHEHPPSVVVLSGDQWPRRHEWHKELPGTTWLHVQHRSMLETAWKEGFRHLILEGCESGGHVGQMPSTILWSTVLESVRRLDGAISDAHCILAGGIHDATAVLFGLLLAKAYAFPGSISFQLGTPLLLTREAVASGALHATYQKQLVQAHWTQLVGSQGTMLRAVLDAPASPTASAGASNSSPNLQDSPSGGPYEAYQRALYGELPAIWLAGESIAHYPNATCLHDIFMDLTRHREAWALARQRYAEISVAAPPCAQAHARELDLAVVGIGGMFPGASDMDAYWGNLVANRRSIREVPPEHWGPGTYRDTEDGTTRPEDGTYAWHAGMITDFTFDQFDCLKFHLSPKAARVADRIHLMLLKATEQARLSTGPAFRFPEEQTVVLVGNSMGGEQVKLGTLRAHVPDIVETIRGTRVFRDMKEEQGQELLDEISKALSRRSPKATEDTLVGVASSTLAGRIAAYLGVFGGNFTVDAACASSLAALSVAGEMLNSGHCACAVIGAVDSDLTVDTFINFCRLKALAHGISRPFMQGSDGFTMGEGAGVIILKRFSEALRDGDVIYARIAGIGMSSDGEAGSLTNPSPAGQRRALARAFTASRFEPDSIGYVEAHGTGTPVGDAVEIQELGRVFSGLHPNSVAMGTVKAHIGHLKSAAGIASLLKVILALRARTIPPAWVEGEPREELQAPSSPFALPSKAQPWPMHGSTPRRAALSSFGFGGSNFHVHLEESDERCKWLTNSRLLLFSGDTAHDVQAKVDAFATAVGQSCMLDVRNAAQMKHLGGNGRCRLAAVWHEEMPWEEMLTAIRLAWKAETAEDVWFRSDCRPRPIAFLFPGQGSVTEQPFLQFRHTVPEFASSMASFGISLGLDLADVLWPLQPDGGNARCRPNDPALQPGTTALSLCLANLLRSMGVVPAAVAGHSLGFYAALAAAGSISERESLKLVWARARCFGILKEKDPGTMLALAADEEATTSLLSRAPVPGYIANLNAPGQTVISLSRNHLRDAEAFLTEQGVEFTPLPVICGFHSPFVADAAKEFKAHLRGVSFHDSLCDLYSETLGERIPPDALKGQVPDWLAEHIVRRVDFVGMLRAMRKDGYDCFLEIGARASLSRFARDTLGTTEVSCTPLDTTQEDRLRHWHRLLATLYVQQGAPIDYGSYARVFAAHLSPIQVIRGARIVTSTKCSSVSPEEPGCATGQATRDAPPASEDHVYRHIRAILSHHSGFEESLIHGQQELQSVLGIDSLKTIDIGLEIERKLGVNLGSVSFAHALTVQGLAELVRNGTSPAGSSPDTVRRYVPQPVEVALPPVAESGSRRVALLCHDPDLASMWKETGYGPVFLITQPQASLPAHLQEQLAASDLDGIVYAAGTMQPCDRGVTLLQYLTPAYAVGHEVLPNRASAQREKPFCFLTAGLPVSRPSTDALCAFSMSLQSDLPYIRCGHVSITDGMGVRETALTLYREAVLETGPFHFVAYRESKRMTTHVVEKAIDATEPPLLRSEDVVLVTGGGRGITARGIVALSGNAKPSWIIVGSTDLSQDTAPARETQETLRRLEQKGCGVRYIRCDVADHHALREMTQTLRAEDTRLTGVIHGAGLIADSGIAQKDMEDFERVIAVKAESSLILEEELDLPTLRFWVNFSSIAALFGNAGQTDYAAASHALLSQADRLRARGVPCVKAVLWGPWSQTGMAARDGLEERLQSMGIALIDPDEGAQLFCKELRSKQDTVVAYCGNPIRLVRAQTLTGDSVWTQKRVAGAQVSLLSRRFDTDEEFLKDHAIDGVPVLPAVMTLDFSAAALPRARGPFCWRNLDFKRFIKPTEEGLVLALRWLPTGPRKVSFECGTPMSADDCEVGGSLEWEAAPDVKPLTAPACSVVRTCSRADLYGEKGILFSGPLFRVVETPLEIGDTCVRAMLQRKPGSASLPACIPATLIDGLFQMAAVYCLHHEGDPFLPTAIDCLWCEEPDAAMPILEGLVVCTGRDNEHMYFEAHAMTGKKTAIVLKRLVMTRMKTPGHLPQTHA
jgi:acyl transferase domain-containing protein/NAD(P)-dependent dehydrogenase (short-subunit alcohol dehydrogenase family)